MFLQQFISECSGRTDEREFSILGDVRFFFLFRERTGEGGLRKRLHTHLFPLDSVCGRGLGLTLPLHFVPEHDDLRLGRDDAHRVDV